MKRIAVARGRFRTLAVLALLGAGLGAAHPAPAQVCPGAYSLVEGTPVHATASPAFYSIAPPVAGWSVVGVRGLDGHDWNLQALNERTSYPTCFTGPLAASAGGQVDFLVADWNHRALQTDYLTATTTDGTGSDALVEYREVTSATDGNVGFNLYSTSAGRLFHVFETQMWAGTSYRLRIYPTAGTTGLRVFVFAPIASGTGWAARADRIAELALVDGQENTVDVTAAADGQYGVVVVNETGVSGSYYFGVAHCPYGSSGLADNLPFYVNGADDWPAFTQSTSTWAAMGVRGNPGLAYRLDAAPGLRSFGTYPECSSSILARADDGPGYVSLLACDFRASALDMYSLDAHLQTMTTTTTGGWVEWEDGADTLAVNGPPLSVSPPSHNVLDAWTVRLSAGVPYTFEIAPGGTTGLVLMLFANPAPGSPYWATRGMSLFQTGSSAGYTPPATGLYGVVVANDGGASGGYSVSVTADLVDVPAAGPPAVSGIRSVAPNPTRAGLRIAYDLAQPGRVALEMRDVSGRAVARSVAIPRPAGPGEIAWDPRAEGPHLAAGVYFVVLTVDGRAVDRAKLAILQ